MILLNEYSFSLFLLMFSSFTLLLYMAFLKNKEKSTYFLIGFYLNIFLLFLSGFLGISIPISIGVKFILFQYVFAQYALVFFLLFAYFYQGLIEKREAFLAGIFSIIVSFLITLYILTILSFGLRFDGRRLAWIAMIAAGEFLWAFVVLLRKGFKFSKEVKRGKTLEKKNTLDSPENRAKRTLTLAYLMLIPIFLSLLVFAAYLKIIPREVHNFVFTEGACLFFFLFVLMYLNHSNIPVSLISKIAGITLVSAIIVLNAVGVYLIKEGQKNYQNENDLKAKLCRAKILSGEFSNIPKDVVYILKYPKEGSLNKIEVVYSIKNWNDLPYIKRDNLGRKFSKQKGNFFLRFARYHESKFYKDPKYFSYIFPVRNSIYEVGLSSIFYKVQLHRLVFKLLVIVTSLFLFIIFIFPLFFRLSIIEPVRNLLEGARQIEKGNLEISLPVKVMDEFGILSDAFNKMASSLRKYREEILEYSRTLEKKVAERTRDLEEKNKMLLKMKEELEIAARTDPLTGLLNRRALYELMAEEVNRAKRHKRNFSLIIGDIDHFKKINDTYGHDCGDHVLKTIADILRSRVREVDKVGRWGGEEFLIILPETSLKGALRVAEKLRLSVATFDFNYNTIHLHATMTFGVAEYSAETSSLNQCLKRADEALYLGKASGRNRVVSLEEREG